MKRPNDLIERERETVRKRENEGLINRFGYLQKKNSRNMGKAHIVCHLQYAKSSYINRA